jgi:hypothetical protein
MLLVDAEMRGRDAIEAHYDALSVELFGVRAAGLSRERVENLISDGYLSPQVLQTENTTTGAPLNPLLFIRRLGSHYVEAPPEERERMRRWDLNRWRGELSQGITPRAPNESRRYPTIEKPQPPELAPPPHERAIPSYFSAAERAGLVSAHRVAGGYIRGLGALYADEFSASVYEEWNGETLLSTPDAERRRQKLKVIREEVGTAVLTKPTAREVAGRIRQRVGDIARNFERIAETELQAVHNEGQIFQAVELDGEEARVARIPESGACSSCRDLFLDPATNTPLIFLVSDLAANGTNVGRPRRSWVATAYPVHPQCRCDTIPLSPDQTVTASGRIVRKK